MVSLPRARLTRCVEKERADVNRTIVRASCVLARNLGTLGRGDRRVQRRVRRHSHRLDQLRRERGSEGRNAAAQIADGRNTWLTSTFGGEQFFSLVLPSAPFSLPLGFLQVLATPRAERFTAWGVINDPDCTDGDATTGGLDKCPDPAASGVVGVRKGPDPTGQNPFLIGVACAGCHAGLDPQNPPADPNHPAWANIHLTTGNQYLNVGKIFGANLNAHDPRAAVFGTWAPGTVDTTAIESDGINNPGIITQFYDFPDRPFFTNHYLGVAESVHRAGQGGEDDLGCQKAALRVYFNIGMCAAECMVPHLANGPGGTQTPIDLLACEQVCPDLVEAEAAVTNECAFINDAASAPAPSLAAAPGGSRLIDHGLALEGEWVFDTSCASCHSNGRRETPHDILSDDLVHPASGFSPLGEPPGSVGTNACRSLTTNWLEGHIWEPFSSDELKARGPGYYRDVPLRGVWATAPFFHNNRLGTYTGDPSVAGRVASFEDAMSQLLNPWERNYASSIQVTQTSVSLPNGLTLPAGTPVALFANLDQATGKLLCSDLVENGGHYFGALLLPAEKAALTEYLKTLVGPPAACTGAPRKRSAEARGA